MKVAVVGSRTLTNIELGRYISEDAEEIVSGGAVGVDSCAAEYARRKGLRLTEILPQYERYGRGAPIVRNKETLVRGEFLTSKASEGVSINPGFDGEDYNFEVK